ncbi:transporter substrate-binding domain-containing protein [Streptococcus sp. S784/96/1]|uniref:transporter substrate-binding domain-containing protein n=1 Tax=Streptococcus sp. S784/96/1 TaxID=2653499 RepID=UPI00138703AF|nr:transporter substrate-binding domain-containing protein [Streptococcus sp. S784/96/1]
MKKLFTTVLMGLATLTLVACGSSKTKEDTSLKDIQDKGKLVVALSPDYAPFEFKTLVDGKDTIVGADVEIAKAIADKLGVELELSPMSFNNVLASLVSKKADIAISGISATEERAKNFDFSDVYYNAKNIVLIKKENMGKYTSASSLADRAVGAQKGSIQEPIVTEQLPDSHLVSLMQITEMVTELNSGKLDAIVMEETIAKGYVANNEELAIAEIPLKEDAGEPGSAVAMAKGSESLKKVIDEVIGELKSSGEIDTFVQEAYELSLSAE